MGYYYASSGSTTKTSTYRSVYVPSWTYRSSSSSDDDAAGAVVGFIILGVCYFCICGCAIWFCRRITDNDAHVTVVQTGGVVHAPPPAAKRQVVPKQ